MNIIAPSVCETPQMLRASGAGDFSFDQVTPLIPIPRAGRPDEIAGACGFLAPEDTAYIAGQALAVNDTMGGEGAGIQSVRSPVATLIDSKAASVCSTKACVSRCPPEMPSAASMPRTLAIARMIVVSASGSKLLTARSD